MNDRTPLTDRLAAGPVICAEGFLFELERRGYLTAGEFVPEVALEFPDALRALHLDYQRAGSDIVEAFTYNGHREKCGSSARKTCSNRSTGRLCGSPARWPTRTRTT